MATEIIGEATHGLINYLADFSPKPVNYAYESPAGVSPRTGTYVAQVVPIRNGREILGDLSLDRQGFVLTPSKTSVSDFYDPEEVKSVYYPEVKALVKKVTGAARVEIFDHVVRNPALARQGTKGVREPAKVAHNDYTFKSAPRRVRDHLPDDAETLLKHRFAEINVWRAIRGPLQDWPLALCDARSIDPADAVVSELVYPDRVGETYGFKFNRNHRWFYFPDLQPDEAVLLKCYDSKDDGRARFTAHTAFEDPQRPLDAPGRESIEVRTLVFWPD
jgi:hypothetical protein